MSHDIDNPEELLTKSKESSRYGSRKFVLALIVITLASWLLKEHAIDIEAWKSVVVTAVLGYMAGNVGTMAVEKWVSR